MKNLRLNVKINIKKLSPVINFGGAAAITSLVVVNNRNSTSGLVINNFIQKTSPLNKQKDVTVPDVVLDGTSSLGQMWSQYLLNVDNHGLWEDREIAFKSLPENNSEFAHSSIFRNARKKAIRTKSRGEILSGACRTAYKIRKRTLNTDEILKDVWKHCRIKRIKKQR